MNACRRGNRKSKWVNTIERGGDEHIGLKSGTSGVGEENEEI